MLSFVLELMSILCPIRSAWKQAGRNEEEEVMVKGTLGIEEKKKKTERKVWFAWWQNVCVSELKWDLKLLCLPLKKQPWETHQPASHHLQPDCSGTENETEVWFYDDSHKTAPCMVAHSCQPLLFKNSNGALLRLLMRDMTRQALHCVYCHEQRAVDWWNSLNIYFAYTYDRI